jgi:tRNA(His) 5'-end guanylyltransferase
MELAMKDLGNRMKENYEHRARHYLTRRTPVIIRVDGRAFHTFTRGFKRPFDQRMIDAMIMAAECVFSEAQGCKLAYVQSDEASFVLTDYDELTTEAWFGYNKSKIESISASIMTAAFARAMRLADIRRLAYFDARAFNIPEQEVVNYFLWRAKDWSRNSVTMLAQAHFSHAELQGKSIPNMHEMLYSIGQNWTTLLAEERNGTFLLAGACKYDIEPHYDQIEALWKVVCPSDC